jgi:hypothetical protein
VNFVAITLCVASQRVVLKVSVYFVIDSVRKLLDLRGRKGREAGEAYIMRSYIACVLYQMSFGRPNQEMRRSGYVVGMRGMHTKYWSVNVRGRDHSEDLDVDGRIILEWILEKYGGKVWTECICLRIETSGGFL